MHQAGVIQAGAPAIEPGEVGRLRRPPADLRSRAAAQGGAQQIAVAAQHRKAGIEPSIALTVGRFKSRQPERIGDAHRQTRESLGQPAGNAIPRGDGRRQPEARDIEGLARRDHRDHGIAGAGDGAQGDMHRCIGGGAVAWRVDQVRVDLVAEDDQPVPAGDVEHSPQLALAPDAPERVVRAAQQQQARTALSQGLEVLQIHGIAAWRLAQRVLQHSPALTRDGIEQGRVDRRLNDHALPRLAEGCHRGVKRGHHARREMDARRLHGPSMPPLQPTGQRL